MADPLHLHLIKRGRNAWERWRQEHALVKSHLLMHLSYLVEHRGILTLTKEAVDVAASMVMNRQSLQQMREYFRETEPL